MRKSWLIAAAVLSLAACREDDGPFGGTGTGTLVVLSSPANGRITLDGRDTGRFTPDTIRNISGLHEVSVKLDSAGLEYRYTAQVVVSGNEPTVLNGPLMARCQQDLGSCAPQYADEHIVGTLQFGSNALGPLFLQSGQGGGLRWPAGSSNTYMATGTPVFAAVWGTQLVSTGVYDTEYLAGRPAPRTQLLGGGGFSLTQSTWIVPPFTEMALTVARGIEVSERVIASTAQEGVLLVELTYRNITNDPIYRILDADSEVQTTGITYTDAYIGLALDPDIGNAEDDWLSYEPSLSSVFAYDASFSEPGFTTQSNAPALVGLRVLRAPAGAGAVLNGWINTPQTPDWQAGFNSQISIGYPMMSGIQVPFAPDGQGLLVGHMPPVPGDARIVASVGPVRLAPGQSATAVFAVVVAAPTAGTYQPGAALQPGTPGDQARPLFAVSANLRSRLVAAESLLGLLQ